MINLPVLHLLTGHNSSSRFLLPSLLLEFSRIESEIGALASLGILRLLHAAQLADGYFLALLGLCRLAEFAPIGFLDLDLFALRHIQPPKSYSRSTQQSAALKNYLSF